MRRQLPPVLRTVCEPPSTGAGPISNASVSPGSTGDAANARRVPLPSPARPVAAQSFAQPRDGLLRHLGQGRRDATSKISSRRHLPAGSPPILSAVMSGQEAGLACARPTRSGPIPPLALRTPSGPYSPDRSDNPSRAAHRYNRNLRLGLLPRCRRMCGHNRAARLFFTSFWNRNWPPDPSPAAARTPHRCARHDGPAKKHRRSDNQNPVARSAGWRWQHTRAPD